MVVKRVFAVDPGYERSALVIFDGERVLEACTLENVDLLVRLRGRLATHADVLVIEQIAAMGMTVGAEVFETCFWSGQFAEAWAGRQCDMAWDRVKRHAVKTHLCGNQRAKDANIRQALIDRFGPGKDRAIGTKKAPGPLYGIHGDEWAALAVAVTWWDRYRPLWERDDPAGTLRLLDFCCSAQPPELSRCIDG